MHPLSDKTHCGSLNSKSQQSVLTLFPAGHHVDTMSETALQSIGTTQPMHPEGIDKLTEKSLFCLRFVFALKIQLVDYHSNLFFNRV